MSSSTQMFRHAVISECRKFRYLLTRGWGDGLALTFVMLNPSTADSEIDDATIRKCIGFAKLNGFTAIKVVNLYAFRATKPSELKASGFLIGELNDEYIQLALQDSTKVVLAWGDNAREKVGRVNEVLQLIKAAGHRPYTLKLTTKFVPSHPLMLPYTSKLIDYYEAINN